MSVADSICGRNASVCVWKSERERNGPAHLQIAIYSNIVFFFLTTIYSDIVGYEIEYWSKWATKSLDLSTITSEIRTPVSILSNFFKYQQKL